MRGKAGWKIILVEENMTKDVSWARGREFCSN